MLNQRGLVIPGPDMDGLWDRGVSGEMISKSLQNTCPPLGFTEAKEIRFFPWGFKTRQGYTTTPADAAWTSIRQIIAYSTNDPISGAVVNGELIVSGADVYDSASPSPGTPILTIGAAPTYISIITLFGRIYITIHDLVIGAATFISIYNPGSGVVARSTGGNPATIAGVTFVSSGTAGNVTQGVHVFGVVFETNSGFINRVEWFPATPGLSAINAFTLANANQQVTAANLPLGTSEVTKRHIIGSRVITTYSGDPSDYELFFIATINDNITTTLTFNFADASLVDSADYLFDILDSVPCGVGLTWYSDRLIVYGQPYIGLNNFVGPSSLLVSERGKPETFSTISGFVDVFKDDGENGIRNCFEQDGLLAICKSNKTYATRDNGEEPNTWQVASVDYTIGSTAFGVTKSLNTTGSSKSGKTIVASKSGIYLFRGQYDERPLTWKIARRWQRISELLAYPIVQIIDIPSAKLFLVAVDNTNLEYATYFLVADYSRGLDWQNIRWAEWHPGDLSSFITLRDDTTLYFVNGGANIFEMIIGSEELDYNAFNDNTVRILGCEVITSELKFDNLLNKYSIAQLRIRGKATFENEHIVTLEMGDDTFSTVGMPIPSLTPDTANPSPEIIKGIINFQGYYPRARFTWRGQIFEVRHMIFSGNIVAEDQLTI